MKLKYVTPQIITARAAVAEAQRKLAEAKDRAFPDGPRVVPVTKGGHPEKRERERKEARYIYNKCSEALLKAQNDLLVLEREALAHELVTEVIAEERGITPTIEMYKNKSVKE